MEPLLYPNPLLLTKTAPVQIMDSVQDDLDNMMFTLRETGAMGLAANQLGIMKRIILVKIDSNPVFMINPFITWFSLLSKGELEGCLSFGSLVVNVRRPREINVSYNEPHSFIVKSLSCKGIEARCIQHEIDHLDGMTFLDRLELRKQQKALKWLSMNPLQE